MNQRGVQAAGAKLERVPDLGVIQTQGGISLFSDSHPNRHCPQCNGYWAVSGEKLAACSYLEWAGKAQKPESLLCSAAFATVLLRWPVCYSAAEMTHFLWQWTNLWTVRKAWEKGAGESKQWIPFGQTIAVSEFVPLDYVSLFHK